MGADEQLTVQCLLHFNLALVGEFMPLHRAAKTVLFKEVNVPEEGEDDGGEKWEGCDKDEVTY
jgi:hypothetical protein